MRKTGRQLPKLDSQNIFQEPCQLLYLQQNRQLFSSFSKFPQSQIKLWHFFSQLFFRSYPVFSNTSNNITSSLIVLWNNLSNRCYILLYIIKISFDKYISAY